MNLRVFYLPDLTLSAQEADGTTRRVWPGRTISASAFAQVSTRATLNASQVPTAGWRVQRNGQGRTKALLDWKSKDAE